MKIVKGMKQLLAEGRAHESQGRWEDAAAVYEQGLHEDPDDPDWVNRALIVYRKLKDSRRELQVIEAALRAVQQRNKAIQDQWLRTHPKAAGAGKAVLRSLGGSQVTAFGANSFITKLLKRKEVVEKRLGGKRASPQTREEKAAGKPKPPANPSRRQNQRRTNQRRANQKVHKPKADKPKATGNPRAGSKPSRATR